jgi:hypothetical protein
MHYTKEITIILIREFLSSDEEMKKVVSKVVNQCKAPEGVLPQRTFFLKISRRSGCDGWH